MDIGIFAKTFKRPSLEEVCDAISIYGFTCTQFNMSCAGLESLPEEIPALLASRIRQKLELRNIKMSAVSGTFNMIHPDIKIRQKGVEAISVLATSCRLMGTNVITLCTGSRDPANMWQAHPDNNSLQAWKDLLYTLEQLLPIAEDNQVILAFEPELGNVINSARKGKKLLETLKSKNLRVVFDPANLFEKGSVSAFEDKITEGIDLLGEFLIMAHAKDRLANGAFTPAGYGILPYEHFLDELKRINFRGDLVLHGLEEGDAANCRNFLAHLLN
jgi:sugar phosphate isomerase/epimerase